MESFLDDGYRKHESTKDAMCLNSLDVIELDSDSLYHFGIADPEWFRDVLQHIDEMLQVDLGQCFSPCPSSGFRMISFREKHNSVASFRMALHVRGGPRIT